MNHKRTRARRNPKTMSLSTYATRMGNSAEHTKPKNRLPAEDREALERTIGRMFGHYHGDRFYAGPCVGGVPGDLFPL